MPNDLRLLRDANCEQRRLIFELSCEKKTIPAKLIPDAALMYKTLQEKLVVETNSLHSTISAIFATNPSNLWSWSLIFDSTATKQIYETRMPRLQRILIGLPTCIGYGAAKQLL